MNYTSKKRVNMNKTYEINYHSEGISQLDNIKRDTMQKFPNFSNLITNDNNNPQNSTNVNKRVGERGLNSIMEIEEKLNLKSNSATNCNS